MIGGVALWGLVQAEPTPVSITQIEDEINFSMADADEDGVVTRVELERRHEAVLEVFDQADTDADGRLTEREYTAARETVRNLSPG